jgi:hypothetical protein
MSKVYDAYMDTLENDMITLMLELKESIRIKEDEPRTYLTLIELAKACGKLEADDVMDEALRYSREYLTEEDIAEAKSIYNQTVETKRWNGGC